jgi:hypothetical protein
MQVAVQALADDADLRPAPAPTASCYWPGGGRLTTVTGIEVGHTMSVKRAGYLRGGIANWAAGFAVLELSGSPVTPTLIPTRANGEFVYHGRIWREQSQCPL